MYFTSVPFYLHKQPRPHSIVLQQTALANDLKSAAYTNNGSIGPYLSIVALKISISFRYNEKKLSPLTAKSKA